MNNKLKLWIAFAAVLVFAAGLVAGIFIDKSVLFRRPGHEGRRGPHPPSLDHLARELGLTPLQKEQIGQIFKQNEERLKVLREQIDARMDEARSQLKNELEKVLTAEQKQKLEAMIQKHIARQRREAEGRNKGEKK